MKTVTSVLNQLTDSAALVQALRDTLRTIDPEYGKEEASYLHAVAALQENSAFPELDTYLAAKEQELAAGLIYAGWLGFQLNLDCCRNPVNALVLRLDYEDICRERQMDTLPMVREALASISALHRSLPEDSGIPDYFTYLQAAGYKLAHYFGFRLADSLGPHILPGYHPDPVLTIQYGLTLQEYLQMDVQKMA